MPAYRKIVRSTPAYHGPDITTPIIFNLEPGAIVEVLSEDDAAFTKATHFGQPVYIRREDTVHASPEEIALVQPDASPSAPTASGFCPHCGAAVEPGARYCRRCGGNLLQTPAGQLHGEAAGFWHRFGALILDGIIILAIAAAIAGVPATLVGIDAYNDGEPYFTQEEQDQAIEDATEDALVIFYPIYGVITLAYFTIGFATGGTLAARLLGLRIVTEDGRAPGLVRGFLRWIVSLISYVVLYIGYLWMLWDDDHQTWHDKAAGTYVVKR